MTVIGTADEQRLPHNYVFTVLPAIEKQNSNDIVEVEEQLDAVKPGLPYASY
jgi:hypothetical protein